MIPLSTTMTWATTQKEEEKKRRMLRKATKGPIYLLCAHKEIVDLTPTNLQNTFKISHFIFNVNKTRVESNPFRFLFLLQLKLPSAKIPQEVPRRLRTISSCKPNPFSLLNPNINQSEYTLFILFKEKSYQLQQPRKFMLFQKIIKKPNDCRTRGCVTLCTWPCHLHY
jgi:hypothetical protein